MEYKLSSFQFADSLSREDKHNIILRINGLRSSCPSDSNFSGEFRRDEDSLFHGHLKVLFSRGEFSANVTSGSIEELLEILSLKIKEQVALWRDVRFDQKEQFIDFTEKAKKS